MNDNEKTFMNNDIFKEIKDKYLRDSQQYSQADGPSIAQSCKSNSLFDVDEGPNNNLGMSRYTEAS